MASNGSRDRMNRAYAQAPKGSSKKPGNLGAIRSTANEERSMSKTQSSLAATRNLPVPTAKNKGKTGTQSGKAAKRK